MSEAARAPDARFLFAHPAHLIALGFGAGLSPVAPGTAGTLVAWPLAWALSSVASDAVYLVVVGVSFAIGVWAAQRTQRALGVADHGSIVVDEIVAFALVFFFVPRGFAWQALAFVLFRFFDIVKLPPASLIDRRWHHGFGVMADDVVAAFYALLVLALAERVSAW